MHYSRILAMLAELPLAMLPSKIVAIRDLMAEKAQGVKFTPEEIAERLGREPGAAPVDSRKAARRQGAIAVLPFWGAVTHRAFEMEDSSSRLISTEAYGRAFRATMADPGVKAVVLDIDSPGGGVYGVAELAAEIHQAAQEGDKPVVAIANGMAASAAYWIGAAAGELVVTPSGDVGSIGVFSMHVDQSKALQAEGLDISLISAGDFKVEGNPFEPLSDVARQAMKDRIDSFYAMFTADVARFRGTTPAKVRNGFGRGRLVSASEAVREGMADRVDTLDGVLRRLGASGGAGAGRSARAEAEQSHGVYTADGDVDHDALAVAWEQVEPAASRAFDPLAEYGPAVTDEEMLTGPGAGEPLGVQDMPSVAEAEAGDDEPEAPAPRRSRVAIERHRLDLV